MLTFNDLVNKKIARTPYKTNIIGDDIQCLDRFVVNYNNIWGCISDTHMSKGADGNYYISGQLFRDKEKTKQFVYAMNWGAYTFRDSSLQCANLYNYCLMNHKTISHDIVNGDHTLVVKPFTQDEEEYFVKNFAPEETEVKQEKQISLCFKY